MIQTDLFARAVERRDTGMNRAEKKANRDHDGWADAAEAALRQYAAAHRGEQFLAEDVRAWAEGRMVVAPDNGRAWGAVFKRSARLRVITRVGYAPAKSSNLAPKCLWMTA